MEEVRLLDISLKLALTLDKIHTHDHGHYDIKDDNIFMNNKFSPVYGDLGIAMTFE